MALYFGSTQIPNVYFNPSSGNSLATGYTLNITNGSSYINTGSTTNGYTTGYAVDGDTNTSKGQKIYSLNGYAAYNTGSNSKTVSNISCLILNVPNGTWYSYYINNIYAEQAYGLQVFYLNKDTTFRPNGTASCFVEGTLITLADGTQKPIEKLTYADELLTWDFDNGCQSIARIAQLQRNQRTRHYNRLVLEDGTELYTVFNHSWFNVTKNRFTRTMEATDINDEIMTINGPKKLVSKEQLVDDNHVWYYNLITENNICCYANGILTGNHFCNIYPVSNMTYIKEERILNQYSDFAPYCSEETFNALRVAEYDYSNYDQEAIEAEYRYLSLWNYHVIPHNTDVYQYHNDYRAVRDLPTKDFNE